MTVDAQLLGRAQIDVVEAGATHGHQRTPSCDSAWSTAASSWSLTKAQMAGKPSASRAVCWFRRDSKNTNLWRDGWHCRLPRSSDSRSYGFVLKTATFIGPLGIEERTVPPRIVATARPKARARCDDERRLPQSAYSSLPNMIRSIGPWVTVR